jgi:hypothetical protein
MVLAFLWLIGNNVFSQGLLLNSNFSKPNICLEYNKPCCFKAWYNIGDLAGPTRLKNRKLVQRYNTFPNFNNQYKNALVGCINHAIAPNSELELDLQFEEVKPMKIGIAFCDSFPITNSYDVNGLDPTLFQFFDLSGKKKQKIFLTNKSTALFIMIVFIDEQTYSRVDISQIVLNYKNKNVPYFQFINKERIQFIWDDRNRHNFSNTMDVRRIMNLK